MSDLNRIIRDYITAGGIPERAPLTENLIANGILVEKAGGIDWAGREKIRIIGWVFRATSLTKITTWEDSGSKDVVFESCQFLSDGFDIGGKKVRVESVIASNHPRGLLHGVTN